MQNAKQLDAHLKSKSSNYYGSGRGQSQNRHKITVHLKHVQCGEYRQKSQ